MGCRKLNSVELLIKQIDTYYKTLNLKIKNVIAIEIDGERKFFVIDGETHKEGYIVE